MADMTCKLLVVGAGPGGYACAIRAGQLGVDTILVEAGRPGGTCLTVGCIPSKALIHAAETFETAARLAAEASPLGIRASAPAIDLARTVAWKDGIVDRLTGGVAGLLRKAKVRTVEGRAIFRDGKTVDVASPTGQRTIRAEMVVIATGSEPVELPALPFGGRVISSTEALSLGAVPKRLVVVGAGYIGLELGGAFARLGSNVAVVEAGPRILPHYDEDLTRPVETALRDLGVEILLGASALGIAAGGDALRVRPAEGGERELGADRILVTAGRRPATEGWGIEALVLERDGSFIRIDETCRTSMRGVYAIGDVTGEPMLAHRAMAQGEMVAEIAAGRPRAFENRAIPAVCYTDPAIVSVGLAPEAARRAGHEIVVGQFPFHANGRALATEATSGFVRVVARAGDHLVLGIQAVGRGVPELSAAFGLAVEMGARLEDVAGTIHAHPTLGEAVQEAAFAALGHPLHI